VARDLLDRERVLLVCEGLDTLAAVVLNGRELGRADDMFRSWTFDVKGILKLVGSILGLTWTNIKARIDREGIWLEELERNPGRFIPDKYRGRHEHGVVRVDLNRPMKEILAELTKHPVTTQLSLTGTLVVARDIAHAKLKERLDRGEGMPQYIKDHPVYYAGPAKTPPGMPSGSFGPTTAGRMDAYVDLFQSQGGSLVMIAKGNRSQQVTDACKKHGGFYLGSIGGPAALLAQENIRKVEVLEYPELGMEAIYRIEVEDFPAFILVDDKGNDFYKQLG